MPGGPGPPMLSAPRKLGVFAENFGATFGIGAVFGAGGFGRALKIADKPPAASSSSFAWTRRTRNSPSFARFRISNFLNSTMVRIAIRIMSNKQVTIPKPMVQA